MDYTQWTNHLPARDEPLLFAPYCGPLVLAPARRAGGRGLLAVDVCVCMLMWVWNE